MRQWIEALPTSAAEGKNGAVRRRFTWRPAESSSSPLVAWASYNGGKLWLDSRRPWPGQGTGVRHPEQEVR